ncbi:MAG: hypothetical protein IJ496_00025 [Ruminococcus sp.]|nr:hypothetical protein [Ruminococcus sp.]
MRSKGKAVYIIILILVLIAEIAVIAVLDDKESDLRSQAPSLEITYAAWIAPETEQEGDYGYVMAAVNNTGNTARTGLPDIEYGSREQDGHWYTLYSDSYYESIHAASGEYYSSNDVIPPGGTAVLVCPVTADAMERFIEYHDKGETLYVTLPVYWAKEQVQCELEMSDTALRFK